MTVGKSEADFGLALVGRYLLFIAIAKGLCVDFLFRIAAEVRVPRPRAAFLLNVATAGALSEFPKGMKESRLVAKKKSLHCLHRADQSFVDKDSVQV